MKKRITALALAASLLLTVPALAAGDSMDNFVRAAAYDGQFSDVDPASPFCSNIAALYEYGLTVGRPDGTFGPGAPLTVGQVVIFAGRIRSLYRTGDPELGPGAYEAGEADPAALPYLRYLQAEGVLGPELDDALAQSATRAQTAHVLAALLPPEALPDINDSLVTQGYASRAFIPDVTEYTPYYQDILALYRQGISVGSDSVGSFLPEAAITRGAAAAMLTRIVDPGLRLTPAWRVRAAYTAEGTALSDLVPPGQYIQSPADTAEMDESIRHMLSQGSNTLSLQYGSLPMASARQVMELALSTVKRYCEQSYNAVSCTYTNAGSITLTFSGADIEGPVEPYRTAAMEAAIAVHDQLWETGAITDAMTEYEKARVYYTWICDNTTYDHSATVPPLSHIAYGLFADGIAVCDGYTGAYNLLLKLEGIQCLGLPNSSHIWTVASLDGTEYHIDTTWGDSGNQIDYAYFAMTPQQSWNEHSW